MVRPPKVSAQAIWLRASRSEPSASALGRDAAIIRMASRAMHSTSGLVLTERYASKLWQKASKPVCAVTLAGRERVTSGSTMAARGKIFLFQIALLSLALVLVMTAHGVVWLPVPAVVLMARMGSVCSVGPAVWQL